MPKPLTKELEVGEHNQKAASPLDLTLASTRRDDVSLPVPRSSTPGIASLSGNAGGNTHQALAPG